METRPTIRKHLDVSGAMREDVALVNVMVEMAKSLKKDWFIVNDMLCGIRHGTSGFRPTRLPTWSPLPEDVWEDYLKNADHYGDGRGNEAKKKRKVSNDVYIGDQMVAAAQIVANEISKVTSAIRVEHDLRESFINAIAKSTNCETLREQFMAKQDYGSRGAYGAFMTLQPESGLPWLHAMFN
ncbi:hypothetical protein Syun_014811 [Stephania yunnanensis]|uniref:Uncharacterized protein n=1 Tax=Stephania yunnanensis TaxID=152371 RepID=A0AAP0JL37_9MAGN